MKETAVFNRICLLIVGALGLIASRIIGVSVSSPKGTAQFQYGDAKVDKPPLPEGPKRLARIVKSTTLRKPSKMESPHAPEPDEVAPVVISILALLFPSPEQIRFTGGN